MKTIDLRQLSFMDGKPQAATAEHLAVRWSGRAGNFRCRLCGHTFKLGDIWRWVYANGANSPSRCGNFFVCTTCDGPDVLEKAAAQELEFKSPRWWWFRREGFEE